MTTPRGFMLNELNRMYPQGTFTIHMSMVNDWNRDSRTMAVSLEYSLMRGPLLRYMHTIPGPAYPYQDKIITNINEEFDKLLFESLCRKNLLEVEQFKASLETKNLLEVGYVGVSYPSTDPVGVSVDELISESTKSTDCINKLDGGNVYHFQFDK